MLVMMFDYEALYEQPRFTAQENTLASTQGKHSRREQEGVSLNQLQRFLDSHATQARSEQNTVTTENLAIELAMEKQRRKESIRKQKVLHLMRSKGSTVELDTSINPISDTSPDTSSESSLTSIWSVSGQTRPEAGTATATFSLMDQVLQGETTR